MKYLSVIIICLGLIACQSNPEEGKEVESLITQLDSIQLNIQDINLDDLKSKKKKVLSITKELEQTLTPDKVSKEDNIYTLSDYRFMKKPYGKMIDQYLSLTKEYEHRKKQLLDLQYYVIHNKFETKEKMDAAILDETNRVKSAVKFSADLKKDYLKNEKEYHRLQTKVDSILTIVRTSP